MIFFKCFIYTPLDIAIVTHYFSITVHLPNTSTQKVVTHLIVVCWYYNDPHLCP